MAKGNKAKALEEAELVELQRDKRLKLRVPVAEVFLPFLENKWTYGGTHGGRGSGKSHFWCDYCITEAIGGHHRYAMLREVQLSLKDSVKQLLEDKIDARGLRPLFKSTDKEIVGPNESLFIFRGLATQTATSIKSLEGFDRGFIEEAQSISARSLELYIPTIRAGDSRCMFAWNPYSPKDPVDKFFREELRDDPTAIRVEANYMHNPWFGGKLEQDMLRDKKNDYEKYQHVWLGQYRSRSEARVFRNFRIGKLDIPAGARPYFGGDWGFSVDPAVFVRLWIWGRTLYIEREVYEVGCEIDHTPFLFAGLKNAEVNRLNKHAYFHASLKGYEGIEGATRWPSIVDSARPETISYMRRHGFPNMIPARKGPGSVEDGIEFLKTYDIVIHPQCKHAIEEFGSYSWKVDKITHEVLPELEDRKNHVIDSCRYAVENLRRAAPTAQTGIQRRT